MIVELAVENLAIIERASLEFGPGFTVLTGETGAGKSLVIDALELVLGERAGTELVRQGSAKAVANLAVDLSVRPELLKLAEDDGLALENGVLFVQREVFAEGRSQCRVGGKLTPVGALKRLAASFVDLHGQHAHQSLLATDSHLGTFDLWIGPHAADLLSQVRERFLVAADLAHQLFELRKSMSDRERRLDLLRFQIQEIEAVAPIQGELEELEMQLARLSHAEKLAGIARRQLGAISEEDGSALEAVGQAVRDLEEASRLDPAAASSLDSMRSALYALQEAVMALGSYADSIDLDPGSIELISDRVEALRKLRRKYGTNEAEVLAFLSTVQTEVAALEAAELSEAELERESAEATAALHEVCLLLSTLRRESAAAFAEAVESELHELAMEHARFELRFGSIEPGPTGADAVEYLFSANVGEPVRPLHKIASGGELSRVMLALKTVLAGKAGVPTLVFDEIDAGLGGRAAAVVGRKLEGLGRHYQVIAISHLPQIAARAQAHYRIEKGETNGRTITEVRRLDAEERVHEIARMLGGEQVTETSLANARELLSGRSQEALL